MGYDWDHRWYLGKFVFGPQGPPKGPRSPKIADFCSFSLLHVAFLVVQNRLLDHILTFFDAGSDGVVVFDLWLILSHVLVIFSHFQSFFSHFSVLSETKLVETFSIVIIPLYALKCLLSKNIWPSCVIYNI